MLCVQCSEEIKEGSVFCNLCGGKQVSLCGSCGMELDPSSAFCNGCGTKVEAEIGELSVTDPQFYDLHNNVLLEYHGQGLETVVLPVETEAIGERAFSFSDVGEVFLPKNVHVIAERAFAQSKNLHTIHLEGIISTIGIHGFSGCISLTKIDLPEGLEDLSEDAFSGCSSLTSITLPSSLRSIGFRAFRDCASLRLAVIKGNPKFESSAAVYDVFGGCASLTIYGETGSTVETYAKQKGIPFELIP